MASKEEIIPMFDQRTPCADCPFRKVNGIPLRAARAVSIMESDKLFHCHKTLDYDNQEYDEEGNSQASQTNHSKVCSGFMILQQKDPPRYGNQMLQVAERMGLYNPQALMENNPAVADIFDTREEMSCECHKYRPTKKENS